MEERKIFILVGGSGSGKTTLGQFLKEKGIPEIVSHTTRKRRDGEIPGVTYYYVTKEEFDAIEKIEWTEYPPNSGVFYALSKKEVENKLSQHGKVFTITDYNGVKQIKAQYPDEVEVIYIHAPLLEMEKRMRERGDSEENIQKRLHHARKSGELLHYQYADYVIENVDLEEAKKRLYEIVFSKEKTKVKRKFFVKNIPPLENLPQKKMMKGYISFEPEVSLLKEDTEFYLIRENEIEKEQITKEQYEYYSCFVLHHLIEKTRYLKLMGHQVAEIDVFHGELEGVVTVAVEFLSKEEANTFIPPEWFGEEITSDQRYKNKNLARYGRPLRKGIDYAKGDEKDEKFYCL